MVTFAQLVTMQYFFISIFLLSNLLNFSTQIGDQPGVGKGKHILKKSTTGNPVGVIGFCIEESEGSEVQEENEHPENQQDFIHFNFPNFRVCRLFIFDPIGTSRILSGYLSKKLYLILLNIRI